MTDISLSWSPATAAADWTISNGSIAVGADLQSAVIVSLFTDRRAPDGYAGTDPRGWWGDSYSPTPWGSRLWTLNRAEISGQANLLRTAQDACTEALQWMVDDGVAASVDVATSMLTSTTMQISVTVTEPSGNTSPPFQYSWAWAGV